MSIFIIKGYDDNPLSAKELEDNFLKPPFLSNVLVDDLSRLTIYPADKMVGSWEVFVNDIKNNGIKKPLLVAEVNKEEQRKLEIQSLVFPQFAKIKHLKILMRQTLNLKEHNKHLVIHGSHRAASAIVLGWKTVTCLVLRFAEYKP